MMLLEDFRFIKEVTNSVLHTFCSEVHTEAEGRDLINRTMKMGFPSCDLGMCQIISLEILFFVVCLICFSLLVLD